MPYLRERPVLACMVAAGIVLASVPARPQTNDEINAGLQFSFSPPGARSMALGYAFAGLADDATAAYTNPAGLLWLRRPEASVEARTSNFKTRYPNLGSATGSPTFCAGWEDAESCLDTLEDLQFGEFDSRVNSAPFLSYVHLFRRRDPPSEAEKYFERWRMALYRHELANFRAEIDRSEGAFIGGEGTARGLPRSRLAGIIGELDLQIQNFGVAAAYALRENLWLGLGLSYYDFRIDSLTRRYRTVSPGGGSPAFPGPTDFSDANEAERHNQSGSDGDVALTAGLLWKNRGPGVKWSIGLVYRQAPDFEFDYSVESSALAQAEAEAELFNNTDPGHLEALRGVGRFEAPDFLSAGFMYAFVEDVFRVTFEYARVGYSSLNPEQNILVNVLEGGGARCGYFDARHQPIEPPVPCGHDAERLGRFTVDDVEELHLGLEYQLRTYPKLILRAGAWLDPDHQMRYALPADIDSLRAPVDAFAPRFAAGQDEIHVTGGFGVVPLRERYQVDLAFDVSDRAEIVSISTVFRW